VLSVALTSQSGYSILLAAAVQVQAMWQALGVDASLRTVPSNVMYAPAIGLLPSGKFEAFLAPDGYTTSPDRADTLTSGGLPPNGRNYTRYADHDVDAWTARARATLDDAKRYELYARISERVRAAAPLTPLLWQEQIYAYNSKLTGVRPETVNSDFWNVYAWSLTP
jgi:peptide/nickel transport system substrate-binding protein